MFLWMPFGKVLYIFIIQNDNNLLFKYVCKFKIDYRSKNRLN